LRNYAIFAVVAQLEFTHLKNVLVSSAPLRQNWVLDRDAIFLWHDDWWSICWLFDYCHNEFTDHFFEDYFVNFLCRNPLLPRNGFGVIRHQYYDIWLQQTSNKDIFMFLCYVYVYVICSPNTCRSSSINQSVDHNNSNSPHSCSIFIHFVPMETRMNA